jgi:hypothetical protein
MSSPYTLAAVSPLCPVAGDPEISSHAAASKNLLADAASPSVRQAGGHNQHLAQQQRRRLGGVLVVLVTVLYVGSGVAIQVLFDDMKFEKPFFFSYISVSLCSSYLLQFGYLRCRRSCVRSTHVYSQELQYELQYVQVRCASVYGTPLKTLAVRLQVTARHLTRRSKLASCTIQCSLCGLLCCSRRPISASITRIS